MMKLKNGKKTGKWFFRAGSKRRKFKVRSKRPGHWTMKVKLGKRNPNKLKKMKKMEKLRKMNKMNKMSKMQKIIDVPSLPHPHIRRKLRKANKVRKIARLPKFTVKSKGK